MLGLILRLREPLSEKGRAEFVHATILSCVAGVVRGLSLVAFIPAAIALTGGGPAWGMPLGFWLVVLALCAVVSFVVEYLLSMRSYSVSFDFLSNMHRAIGDKVASLPLGSFRADTAGKTSRLVSRELMVLGEIFAHMYSPLIAAVVTSLTMLVGIAVFSPALGLVCVPEVGRRVERTSRSRAVSPHRRICDQAGGAAGVRAVLLLRAPPAQRRSVRGGRTSFTHDGNAGPDCQRNGRADSCGVFDLRDRSPRGWRARQPRGGSGCDRPVSALHADSRRHRSARLRVRNSSSGSRPQSRNPLRPRTARTWR